MQRWDPFSDSFRMVERFGGRFRGDWQAEAAEIGSLNALAPRADLFDSQEGVIIEVEMAGIAPEAVSVRITDGTVVVEAERNFVRNGRNVMQLEMPYGQFRREFQLPIRSLPAQASAEVKLGVLRIFVPRVRQASTETTQVATPGDQTGRTIEIRSALSGDEGSRSNSPDRSESKD